MICDFDIVYGNGLSNITYIHIRIQFLLEFNHRFWIWFAASKPISTRNRNVIGICFFIRVPVLWLYSLWNILRLSGEHIQFACTILAALVGYGWLLVPVWHCWVRIEAKWCCHFRCWKRCALLSECHGCLPDSLISDPFADFCIMAPHQNFQQLGILASLFTYPTHPILSLDVMRSWLHVSNWIFCRRIQELRCLTLNHWTFMCPPVLLAKNMKATTVPSILLAGGVCSSKASACSLLALWGVELRIWS